MRLILSVGSFAIGSVLLVSGSLWLSLGSAAEPATQAHADAAVSNRLIGLWGLDHKELRGVAFYRADGTCISANQPKGAGASDPFRVIFRWKVENGRLIRTVVEPGTSGGQAGDVVTAEIVELRGDRLQLRNSQGELLSYTRQPMPAKLAAQARAAPPPRATATAKPAPRDVTIHIELPPAQRTIVRPSTAGRAPASNPSRNAVAGKPRPANAPAVAPQQAPSQPPPANNVTTARRQVARLMGAIEILDQSFHRSTNFGVEEDVNNFLDDWQASWPGQRPMRSPAQRVLGHGIGVNGQAAMVQRINQLTGELLEAARALPAAEAAANIDRLIELSRRRARRWFNPGETAYLGMLLNVRAGL